MGIMSLRRQVLMAQPHLESVTGANGIATFDTDFIAPVNKTVIPFSPVQSGSGDPSPDNIRPITGWTGCEIYKTGKNLFNESTAQRFNRWLSTSDSKWKRSTESYSYTYRCEPNTTYEVTTNSESVTLFRVAYINVATWSGNDPIDAYSIKDTSDAITSGTEKKHTITTGEDAKQLIIQLNYGVINSRSGNVEVREYDEKAVSWQSEAGTVYGGTLTINEDGSADLERDSALNVSRGTYSTWESFGSGTSKYYRYKLSSDTNYITNRSSAICTHFARTTISASTTDIGFQIQLVTSGTSAQKGTWIAFRPDLSVYDTLTKFKNYVEEQYENGTPVQYFVYYTDVRATYHFDNVGALHAVLGENHIWTYLNGSPTVTFWKHG